ncbi:Polysaccharide lyase [Amycolatopsis xylanica]|uniref:Polysaccharide lyase n=1 Tax=Amycolatopsis xylanica TaxID=589385 RepID=A0A1H3NIZ1_9PSEU|nr:heparin lyase I family protein [Amycolatopsis xylanica]SDY88778.1 Polysaccharide lyase [Amycolatopsis xylanica]
MSPISRRTALGALAATPLLLTVPPAAAVRSVLWTGDPARGTKVFDGLETDPGTIGVAADPQGKYGQCFRYDITDWANGKERCETRGLRKPDGSVLRIDNSMLGQTQYIGWRSLWQGINPNDKWVSVYQLHISGYEAGKPQSGPYVLRTVGDGKLNFQLTNPNGSSKHIWSMNFPLNSWNSFVIGYKISKGNDGWTEFWVNGKQQTFSNGQTRYPGPTIWGDHLNHKWGIYRSGGNSGKASAFLNGAKLGTTYADVAL